MLIILSQYYSNSPTPDYDVIAKVLRGRGHEVWVATPNDYDELIVRNGPDIIATLKKPVMFTEKFQKVPGMKQLVDQLEKLVFAMRLRRFIRQYGPDVIQINPASLAFFWFIPLAAQGGTSYIIDWRQISEREFEGLLGKIKSEVALQYRRIPSRYIYDQACFLHPAGAKKVLGKQWQQWATVVPLAVSASFFSDYPETAERREREFAVRFVYVGTLSHVRRLERVIMAAQELRSAASGENNFLISFIGPDKSDGYYQRMIDQLDLDVFIKILPPVSYQEVPKVLAQHDVALAIVPEYPLDWQYHPTLKVLEYRALGMPIIATDLEPNREVVKEGVNGLLVTNSPKDIASAMQRFICEDEFLEKQVADAQAMRQGLLWPDVSEQYAQLYQRLIQRKQ